MRLDELLNSNPGVKQRPGQGGFMYEFQSGNDKITVMIDKDENFKNCFNIGFERVAPGKRPTQDLTNSGDSITVFSGVFAAVKKFMNSHKVDMFTVFCVPSRESAYKTIISKVIKSSMSGWTILTADDERAPMIMKRVRDAYKHEGREVFYLVKTSKINSLKQNDDPEAIIRTPRISRR